MIGDELDGVCLTGDSNLIGLEETEDWGLEREVNGVDGAIFFVGVVKVGCGMMNGPVLE